MEPEKWKQLREFPNYMINPEGVVVNHTTGKVITPVWKDYQVYVRLYKNGRMYNRGLQKLLDISFPPDRSEDVLKDWRALPEFPKYEINKYGEVRKITSKRVVKEKNNRTRYVNLNKDAKTYSRAIIPLMKSVGHPVDYR